MGFSKKLKRPFLGSSRRPIYTNSQTSTLIGVATLGADIPTNIHRKKQKIGDSSVGRLGIHLLQIVYTVDFNEKLDDERTHTHIHN